AVLALPEPGETHRGPQFPCSAVLPPGRLDGLAEAALRGDALIGRLGQQQLALEAIQLGLLETLVVFVREGQSLVQGPPRVRYPAGLRRGGGKHAELRWKEQLSPAGPEGLQPLQEEGHRFLPLALQEHSSTLERRARGGPQCKSLFGRDPDLLLGGGPDLG